MKSEPKPPTFEQGVQTYAEMTTDVRTTGMAVRQYQIMYIDTWPRTITEKLKQLLNYFVISNNTVIIVVHTCIGSTALCFHDLLIYKL